MKHYMFEKTKHLFAFIVYSLLPLIGGGWVGVSCADYNDYNSVPEVSGGDQPGANKTLWENISNDPQLIKFMNLTRQCNFIDVLNSPRFYTVWAPVDDAISEVEYNQLMASDSATIVKQFMQQHMTEYNHPVSASLDSTMIISLNAKHHPFTQTTFDGFPYVATNLAATNGVMHKINGLSEFRNNLYENIDYFIGCDLMKEYLQKNDVWELDKTASVPGPLRDGQVTWLDSVMTKHNEVIRKDMRADLEDEDSTYCMIVPNDNAWNKAYNAIQECYKYIDKMDYMNLDDKVLAASEINATTAKAKTAAEPEKAASVMKDSMACYNIVRNLVFSKSYSNNLPLFGNGSFTAADSAVSTSGARSERYLTNMNEVLNHTVATNEMSNGITRTVDSLTFRSWETYNPVISITDPAKVLRVKGDLKGLTTHNIPLDSLAERDTLFSKVPKMIRQRLFPAKSRFFSYVAVDSANIDGSTAKPEFDFALKDVRSATYHIYVVTVPAQVEKPEADVKPYYLRFYLSWTDAANKQQYAVLPKGSNKDLEITTAEGTNAKKLICLGDPGRVNVIDLGEVDFPACYYGLDAYPSLMMMHTKTYNTTATRKKYDQQMRVAGVFLVPKECNDYWANSGNE